MAELWSRKFALDGIHPTVVTKLGDSLTWEHPPTLPAVTTALQELQEKMRRELAESQALKALPAPSQVAAKDSPVRMQAMAEIRRFLGQHRMPT